MKYKDFYNDDDLLTEVKQELANEGLWDDAKSAVSNVKKYASNVKKSTSNAVGKAIVDLTAKAYQVINKYSPERLQAWFEKWMESQKREGLSWTKELPDCPCQLSGKDGNFENPNPKEFDGPAPIVDPALHPGASYELRSIGTETGQQCCYDANGKLMTTGDGVGTADKFSPTKNKKGHYVEDVVPFVIAMRLDGGKFGKNVQRYVSVRPPNVGKGCPTNAS